MFPWCLHSPQQQQSNSFRPRTTLNLHNDAILDLNCTAGHLLLSPHRQTDTVAGRINPLCCANMSTHSLLALSHGTMTSLSRVTAAAARFMSHIHTQRDAAVPSCLTYRGDERARRDSLAPTPFTELVVDTFQRRKSACQVIR